VEYEKELNKNLLSSFQPTMLAIFLLWKRLSKLGGGHLGKSSVPKDAQF
jgi:hypothetical protein